MGGWLSYLWWGGDPDAVNALSGLTRREVYAVQKSWAPVYANSVANGTELLKRLYRAYPETKEFFKMVRKLPEEEFAANIQFKAHVINLMSALDQAVANLNQPEVVAAMMRRLGESHNKRQIKETHFHGLKEVIVKMFIEVLKLDDATLGAWGKTVDFWYKHVFETLEDQDTMGSWLSYLWWGGDPEASNALSGLTRREVYAVQNSWAPVYKDSVANGSELLKRLFHAYPDTREFFKMVRKLPEHEYESNMQFKAHVVNLMNAIDLAVRHMNQPDVIAAMMENIGESHKKRKISEQQFLDLKDVLLKMFIEVLKLDDTTLTAWSKTIDFWYKQLFIHLN